MPGYVRWFVPGGTYFFTVVTERRRPLFAEAANRTLLGEAFRSVAADFPFETVALVLLPDHLHAIWTLPDGDANYSDRWRRIKHHFTTAYLNAGGIEQPRSDSRVARGNRGVWQRRFHEHVIRDDADFGRHVDYVHFNAAKHGLVRCPHEWPHSSFHRWVARGDLRRDWLCVCHGRSATPNFSWGDGLE